MCLYDRENTNCVLITTVTKPDRHFWTLTATDVLAERLLRKLQRERKRGNSLESTVIMDRTLRRNNQSCLSSSSVTEHEYDMVDDQEEVLSLRILPARPMNEDYADRAPPRPSSQGLSSHFTGNSNNLSRSPRREAPHFAAPAVNRDLKPSRRKTRLETRSVTVQTEEQHPRRCSLSPPSSALDSVPGLTPHKTCWRNGQEKSAQKNGFSSQATGPQSTEPVSGLHINHRRHFLDQDTRHIDSRSRRNLERAPEKHHHHEWPQTKRDFDQHDFVPKEKPQQMYCEEDWYIGACNRADAEHALHLVNKDGAFLVRDCSVNTNSEPLVLSVYHEKKVYNVKIRFSESAGKYVLGTGQRSNDMFDSVADIIRFHSIFPIILISGRNLPGSKYAENCVLTYAVTRKDVNQLLQ
ncbi:hypothetical protein JOB18_006732 [Solea senegalensis]|uniref:SH2 domain-containing protein n=1 Tax=Solea senegalensis TaxID=28829 RepID=A0AAV6SJZ9_SOLSE|nr:cytokine-dependent hematopoietic cell linker [Solea senegalensis]XP_043896171.1 cytokine-dependent hematopoietic cell linker [Solea senegalensis]KAG7517400.1 hypothetical protein JOB18_006732 [Solea senegalensis]